MKFLIRPAEKENFVKRLVSHWPILCLMVIPFFLILISYSMQYPDFNRTDFSITLINVSDDTQIFWVNHYVFFSLNKVLRDEILFLSPTPQTFNFSYAEQSGLFNFTYELANTTYFGSTLQSNTTFRGNGSSGMLKISFPGYYYLIVTAKMNNNAQPKGFIGFEINTEPYRDLKIAQNWATIISLNELVYKCDQPCSSREDHSFSSRYEDPYENLPQENQSTLQRMLNPTREIIDDYAPLRIGNYHSTEINTLNHLWLIGRDFSFAILTGLVASLVWSVWGSRKHTDC